MNPLQHLMPVYDLPIEERIAEFEKPPTDEQLGTLLGYGLMGSSGTSIKDDGDCVRVVPELIPIRGVTIWMYFVLTLIAVAFFFVQPQIGPKMFRFIPWLMLLLGGLFVIPTMISMFSWINERTGKEPYLVFDKSTQVLSLPRLQRTLSQRQLIEIVFLDRYHKKHRCWQVALLAQEDEKWVYLQLFNEAGTGTGMACFGVSELYEKIANELGINARRLKFSIRKSELLTQAPEPHDSNASS
jgi:hypothetical protein